MRPAMSDDAAYDEYLEACLAGHVEEPAAFLARHADVSDETRAGVEAVYRNLKLDRPAIPFDRLGEFRLLEPLDAGGMGNLYVAEQESLGRVVALKIVRPEFAGSEEAQRRFEREAHAVAQLHHPNIVTVHAAGSDRGVRYLAMEMVPGRQLDDILAAVAAGRETLETARVVKWVAQLSRALHYAHGRGIVHRDVKPSNVRITPDDTPRLLDFGIAHEMGATQTTSFAGSPSYAAPEQIAGRAVDGRTDVYGLGVTLYQCLTGIVPFAAETVEGVFHRVLHEAATPPRRLRQAVSRELETVTLKAMAKEPAERYPSAEALAEDLEAVLAHRPIRARPPGPLARAGKWLRRRPAAAVALTSACVLILLFARQRWAAAEQRRDEARDLLRRAQGELQAYREQRDATRDHETKLERTRRELNSRYFTPEEDERYARDEALLVELRRDRDDLFHRVLGRLRRAEELDPDLPGCDRVRAALYFEKWDEAKLTGDMDAQVLFRGLVARLDRDHEFSDRFVQRGHLEIASEPPGAECHLFRYRELRELRANGERRLVPVPVGDYEPPVPYGSLVRRVVGTGELILDDRATEQPTRLTAAPAFVSDASLVGRTPVRVRDLPVGDYLVILRLDGYDDLRYAFDVTAGGTHQNTVRLVPRGGTPAGWVHVPEVDGYPAFRIMEREVTAAEYLEFLNLATPTAEAPLVPRGPGSVFWSRGADERYALPDDWKPDHPIVGVSFHDAEAYVRWASRRAGTTFALPTVREWSRAAGEYGTNRIYVFGNVFRPKWTSSNWSRPKPGVEPVMSYPIDESIYQAYDMAGSAMEWLDSPYFGDEEQRWLAGGSWGHSDPALFSIPGGWGAVPHSASGVYGFRMVCR